MNIKSHLPRAKGFRVILCPSKDWFLEKQELLCTIKQSIGIYAEAKNRGVAIQIFVLLCANIDRRT